jgi:Mlc titration factor MtfA (ptsG expression regulator)
MSSDQFAPLAVILVLAAIIIRAFLWERVNKKIVRKRLLSVAFPANWRALLVKHVGYYNTLAANEKDRFETQVKLFVGTKKITGIGTGVEDLDRILIAASAIIPVFAFREWEYDNLDEVLLYPNAFSTDFQHSGPKGKYLGMVGTGRMSGVMMLSKKALRLGFSNETNKKNVGIHEFAHLVDLSDGQMDGLPVELWDKPYAMPWINMMRQKIIKIKKGRSGIDQYGATSQIEFFAVTTEYFFKRPDLLREKHPELYKVLKRFFRQDPARGFKKMVGFRHNIGNNALCHCESGKKYKHCCQPDQ